MPDEIQFKDITFTLDKLSRIQVDVSRDNWTVRTAADMESGNVVSFKPRSLATKSNFFSPDRSRKLTFKPRFKDEAAGNISILEYDNYMFIFDMILDEKFRGKGGGTLMMDLFKASIIFSDKDWAGGFVGDGNTKGFLKSQGFSRAEFESWTGHRWGDGAVSGEFVTDKDYYNIPNEDRFGLAPTPTDLKEEHHNDAISVDMEINEELTEERERKLAGEEEADTPILIQDMMHDTVFPVRVKKEVADPFWEGGYSTWFKIKSRQIEYEDSVFPITERSAPVLDRFRDPTFTVF